MLKITLQSKAYLLLGTFSKTGVLVPVLEKVSIYSLRTFFKKVIRG